MKATLKCVTDDIDEISDNNYFDIKSILFQITNAVKWSFWSLNIFLHIGSKKGEKFYCDYNVWGSLQYQWKKRELKII